MGRDTDIYKFNKEKARSNLYSDITSKTKFKETFNNFLERRNRNTETIVSYESICDKVKSDINSILPSELFELTFWLEEIDYDLRKSHNDITHRKILFDDNGIQLLLNLHGLDAYGYMFQLGTFSDHFEIEGLDESNNGMNLDSSYFIQYLDYIILLMSKILEQQIDGTEYGLTDEQVYELVNIKKENNNFSQLSTIVDSETEYLEKCWNKYKEDEILFSKLTPEIQTIFQAEIYLNQCIKMKRSISNLNNNIIIVDSI